MGLSSMLRSSGEFLWRHKKKVVFGGLTVGCIYFGTKKLISESEKFLLQSLESSANLDPKQKVELSLSSAKREAHLSFLRFLSVLKQKQYEKIPLEKIISQLKQLQKQENTSKESRNQLWEEAKILGFTRYFVAIYSFTLLHLLIHIPLHLLGRQTFETSHLNETARYQFLSSIIQFFLENGLNQLIDHVQEVVTQNITLLQWRVHEKKAVAYSDLHELLNDIHLKCISDSSSVIDINKKWSTFLIFPEEQSKIEEKDESLVGLLNEFRDILESSFFVDSLLENLNRIFNETCKDLQHLVFLENSEQQKNQIVDGCVEEVLISKSPPLAKIIPTLKIEINQLLSDKAKHSSSEKYANILTNSQTLEGLCESIFLQGDKGSLVL